MPVGIKRSAGMRIDGVLSISPTSLPITRFSLLLEPSPRTTWVLASTNTPIYMLLALPLAIVKIWVLLRVVRVDTYFLHKLRVKRGGCRARSRNFDLSGCSVGVAKNHLGVCLCTLIRDERDRRRARLSSEQARHLVYAECCGGNASGTKGPAHGHCDRSQVSVAVIDDNSRPKPSLEVLLQ
ncbi:hypothetical protein DFJ73DRAFT_827130 [Zopfochytrium polystomum]|nr:hypothetical protein DFJ73DRAFT_827130 [Zopfochytrium polystomum]